MAPADPDSVPEMSQQTEYDNLDVLINIIKYINFTNNNSCGILKITKASCFHLQPLHAACAAEEKICRFGRDRTPEK